MADEKSFLQTIKMEISRNFKLVPYERIAFHKILGMLKSDTGRNILLKELDKGEDVRESAIETLVLFKDPSVLQTLVQLLNTKLNEIETYHILDYIEYYGSAENSAAVIQFLKDKKDNPEAYNILAKAFKVLKAIGASSEEVLDYLLSFIKSDESKSELVPFAVMTLSSFKVISTYEELLKKNDEAITHAVYMSLYILGNELQDTAAAKSTDKEGIYSYSPENEDKVVLDIRVLLGKLAPRFDSYSRRVKVAFISAMISCNHREYLIYLMKALTSKEHELVTMILYALHSNITRLKDPDKLFRSMIALSTESERDNDLIVDIFIKYFSRDRNTRQYNILKDKLYSYIVVTLESYFETFRKEFMITDVIEKSFPDSFQKLRNFILEKFTPDLKKSIVTFLSQDEPAHIKDIIVTLSKWITYIDVSEKENLDFLIQVLYEKDVKSRENTATRLEDLNFEKRYLRNRIIRLSKIIEGLSINEASSTLVNIYNYLKKYPEGNILHSTIHTLSMLNYSYMLSEIELMLTSGVPEDQKMALDLISLFHEQRSLNILIDYLQTRIGEESGIVESILNILLGRDIIGNATMSELFKKIIESNKNIEIKRLAILGLGKCGFDSDIDYLNTLFYEFSNNDPKESIVRAMGTIISISTSYNRRAIIKLLNEYLKDPGIKVRIYSCLLLIKMGDTQALKFIRDMLVIKNKGIQRDILTILGELRSIEFSFFLISLLKEEYGISGDIVPVIEKLPEEDLKEIDGFVVNIFRKYETPDFDVIHSQTKSDQILINGLKQEEMPVLTIDIFKLREKDSQYTIPELITLSVTIKSLIYSVIENNRGTISRMSNRKIIAYFSDVYVAVKTALDISTKFKEYNRTKTPDKQMNLNIRVTTRNVKIINEELIQFSTDENLSLARFLPFSNNITCNQKTTELILGGFNTMIVPELVFYEQNLNMRCYEIVSPVNFASMSEAVLNRIIQDDEEKVRVQMQIESELKKMKFEKRTTSTVAIARDLEDIGDRIKAQLAEVERYVQKRSTDRELINNVRKMLTNVHNLYKVEISRLIIE